MSTHKQMIRSTSLWFSSLMLSLVSMIASCTSPSSSVEVAIDDSLSGGSQTVFVQGVRAYSQMMPNISAAHAMLHDRGDVIVSAQFVPAPASINRGLGPLFNANSCEGCHVNDGRGRPPEPGEVMTSLLFRISVPGNDAHGGPVPVPGFGMHLQQQAILGAPAEAKVECSYSSQTFQFADGTPYELAVPHYTVVDPYLPLPAGVMLSPRVAQSMIGLGLLESISNEDILAHEDPNDVNGDGIRGHANMVWDDEQQVLRLGRFGWKCDQPSIRIQAAAAALHDMGITNPVFRVETCHGQPQYAWAVDSAQGIELGDSDFVALTTYVQTVAVPGRRNVSDPEVRRGKKIVEQANCSCCHTPKFTTGSNPDFPELSHQTIFPYTDLLLHHMGPDLADGRPVFLATGSEWRTAPLWGLGLMQSVNGHTRLLHDGRARSIMEAIMWHGGEALRSREYVRSLSKEDRGALLAFLESL